MTMIKSVTALAIAGALAQEAPAKEANVRTPAPVIHLLENLDESDGHGWCIDTVGRGYAEYLHAHSCKPQGGDVQFAFEVSSERIQSVAFPGKCVVSLPQGARTEFGLADCNANDPAQRFTYDSETLSLHHAPNPAHCLAVGKVSRPAGPFMSRDLIWTDCHSSDPQLRSWIIKN